MIVGNGHLWDPSVPDCPGRFARRVMRSGPYRDAGDFRGERVLVVESATCRVADLLVRRGRPVSVQTTSVDGALKLP